MFISYAEELHQIIENIIESELHAKWLNTLSYLENCGARKIAASEHPTLVKEEILKHASEEFRHAHHLKRQIEKISNIPLETYNEILGGISTLQYLKILDLQTSRYLKNERLPSNKLKEAAYMLVTYAIELRASELYPIYDSLLRKVKSPVSVKSILLEEKEHLQEMQEGLESLPNGLIYANQVCSFESTLCQKWIKALIVLQQKSTQMRATPN